MAEASYLFSVDLEDLRDQVTDGGSIAPRLRPATERYLRLLERLQAKATFFVVGEVARSESDLIRRIIDAGHEIACHSDRHIPLDRLTPETFRADVERNLEALRAAGAGDVRGYRAPCFSLTRETSWAYAVLARLGFTWSSSVLPARNPLYGWPGFGETAKMVDGVLELPMTLLPWPGLRVPMGGGLYLRVFPEALLRSALARQRARGEPLLGYLHPFDIDAGHPPVRFRNLSWLLNQAMHLGRGATERRIEMIAAAGYSFRPYGTHAAALLTSVRRSAHG